MYRRQGKIVKSNYQYEINKKNDLIDWFYWLFTSNSPAHLVWTVSFTIQGFMICRETFGNRHGGVDGLVLREGELVTELLCLCCFT